jgi:glycosyltransferase involved in cell wall biosynthesis
MKVVLVHNLQYGGAFRRMAEQVSHMDIPVAEVTLEGSNVLTDTAVVVPLDYRGEEAHPLVRPFTRYRDLLSLVHSYRRLHAIIRDCSPDVIWLNPCRYLQAPWLPADLGSICVYYCDEVRRADYDQSVRQGTRLRSRVPYWPLRRMVRYLDRATVSSVAHVATNSSYSRGQIRLAYGVDSEVIPCGVSRQFKPPIGNGLRDHLLSVGSLIPSKGHDLAVRAAGLSDLRLPVIVVAPRQNLDEQNRLVRIAEKSGVSLEIKIGVTDAELVRLYQRALATLYLAHGEPFGLVSLEAQACGSPVIVSSEGGLPETVIPGVTGWVVPLEEATIAARLSEFRDLRRVEQFGLEGAKHSVEWSWDESAKGLQTMFEAVSHR